MLYYLWKKIISNKYNKLKEEIINLKGKIQLLSDEEIVRIFDNIRQKIKNSPKKKQKTLLEINLVEVYALISEVIFRKLNISLHPTQIMGAIVLHFSNIAQMNTGEGKTITAFLPACLNSMTGRPVFIATVNEYLAQRDQKLAEQIFSYFGISSGVNLAKLSFPQEKKKVYENSDVIYTTSSELGFDYLRNNIAKSKESKINFDYYYVIVDEADSILIDEAQNPLIISHPNRENDKERIHQVEYMLASKIVRELEENKDYELDEKKREVLLKDSGLKKIKNFYQIKNLFEFINHKQNFLIYSSLKAKCFFKKMVDYVIDEEKGKVVIIDLLTGRLVKDRIYDSGIQQAIQSKEGVKISQESKVIAKITYQNFFRFFEKLSGMTGTAESEKEEFREFYGTEVFVIKPYRKLIRKDRNDKVFFNKKTKYEKIVSLVRKNNEKTKRPILIGTPSVEVSEELSFIFKKENIKHEKLNATNHEKEAEIISKAGQIGAITISTNMAGRGTDIILSEESKKAGGLLVIGVERNPVRRIDDQLKGRSGRQGDPGESIFYISLEDEMMKNFKLKEKIINNFKKSFLEEVFPLSGKFLNLIILEAQESFQINSSYFRKELLNQDLLINKQRREIYLLRDKILNSKKNEKIKTQNFEGIISINEEKKENLIKRVDNFWSHYLEFVSELRKMLRVQKWANKDPEEVFFWKTKDYFEKELRKLKKESSSFDSN